LPLLSITVPEPFTSNSSITLVLAKELKSRLHLYDLAGRRIHDVFVGMLPAGTSHLNLPAPPAAGAYLLRVEIGKEERSVPLIAVP
jgi:hypothetical protein